MYFKKIQGDTIIYTLYLNHRLSFATLNT